MYGYSGSSLVGLFRRSADVASMRCASAMTVRVLKIHMEIPFLPTHIPLCVGGVVDNSIVNLAI